MTIVDQDRASIHEAVDELSATSLSELKSFIAYLRFKEHADWFGKLYDLFAPVREAIAESGMTEGEIDQSIDEGLDRVRNPRTD